MNKLNSIGENFIGGMSVAAETRTLGINEKGSFVVNMIKAFPAQMRNNTTVAYVVIGVVNTLFMVGINATANRLEKLFESSEQSLSKIKNSVKHLLVNGLFVGGSTLTLNMLFFKIINYPMNKPTLLAVTLIGLAVRISVIVTSSFKKTMNASSKQIEEIAKKEGEIAKKEGEIAKKEGELIAKENQLKEKEQQLKELEAQLLNKQIKEKEEQLISEKPVVSEKPALEKEIEQLKLKKVPQVIEIDELESIVNEEVEEMPPPPPPPPLDVPVIPVIENVERFFANEPEDLDLVSIPPTPKDLDVATIKSHIKAIEGFISQVEKALAPVTLKIAEYENRLKSTKKFPAEKIKLENAIAIHNKRLEILEKPGDAFLIYKEERIPVYGQKSPEEIKQLLKTKNGHLVLFKSELLAKAKNLIKKTDDNLKSREDENSDDLEDLKKIEKDQNNGILFKDYQVLYSRKQKKLDKWRDILSKYRKQETMIPTMCENTLTATHPIEKLTEAVMKAFAGVSDWLNVLSKQKTTTLEFNILNLKNPKKSSLEVLHLFVPEES